MPFLDVFLHYIAIFLFGARQMKCFPSPGALLPKNRKGPKRIAAMKRNGMVKNMQDTHLLSAAGLPIWLSHPLQWWAQLTGVRRNHGNPEN
jgi:hypothetical protein